MRKRKFSLAFFPFSQFFSLLNKNFLKIKNYLIQKVVSDGDEHYLCAFKIIFKIFTWQDKKIDKMEKSSFQREVELISF